jgi:3-dehydroquinate synthase
LPSTPQPIRVIRIDVTSERGSYPVLVGAGLTASPTTTLASFDLWGHALTGDRLIVSSPAVWKLHGTPWRGVAGKRGPALIADGEKAKTLATVSRLYEAFSANHLDRAATIIAIGGGVIGDVAGFAAATFLRGLRVIHVPTTLLAQVDSAIGGKTGVNLASGKNLVGSFHSPAAVLCDPGVLTSLPRREFRAGLYEVIKYGVIAAPEILDTLERDLTAIFDRRPAVLTPLIGQCCEIKAAVVMSDEREAGPRRALNFGHTFGHALEAVTKYRRFRHGEAIGYGMLAAARLSVLRGLMTPDEEARLTRIIRSLGPMPVVTDLKSKDVLAAATHDKKVVGGTLHFVAADHFGKTIDVKDVSAEELKTVAKSIGLRA